MDVKAYTVPQTTDLIIARIISQHAEEAAFLWLLRRTAVVAPHFNLSDLAKLDNRIEAQLDGVRIAGDVGDRKSVV